MKWCEMVLFGAGPEISPENNGCAFRYYKKGLAPKNYGVETVEELAGLVSDTVVICPPRVQFSEDFVRAEGGGLGVKHFFSKRKSSDRLQYPKKNKTRSGVECFLGLS